MCFGLDFGVVLDCWDYIFWYVVVEYYCVCVEVLVRLCCVRWGCLRFGFGLVGVVVWRSGLWRGGLWVFEVLIGFLVGFSGLVKF